MITNVDENGRHTVAHRYSFGAKTDLGFGGLVNLTGSGRSVDLVDAGAANDAIAQLNDPDAKPKEGIFFSKIDAADSVVEAVAESVQSNPDYDVAPGFLPGKGGE